MAFCGNCGTQVSDGTKFCPNCGSPVGVARQQNYQASQQSYQSPQQAYQTPHPQPAYAAQSNEGFFHKLFRNKWFWIVFVVLGIGAAASRMNYSDQLEKDVKKEMIKTAKEKGYTLVVNDFALVKESHDSNKYSGIAKCTIDGEPIDLDVEVVCDGKRWHGSWEPTAEYYQQYLEDLWDETFTE